MKSVAIDGPAGAGKSTIAKAAAKRLGYIYVDTGALYRAVALFAIRNGIDTKNAEMLVPKLAEILVELVYEDGNQNIYLCGENVTDEIRRPEMGMLGSDVSAIPQVRDFLLATQRNLAVRHSVIMDGRDIGTVVLPDADVKIFLTASAEVRAARRKAEYAEKGRDIPFEDVLAEIEKRDYNDTTRKTAPLCRAVGAVLLDTTNLDFESSLDAVMKIINVGGDL